MYCKEVMDMNNCCGKGQNCFVRLFNTPDNSPDINSAVAFYKSCHKITKEKTRNGLRGNHIMSLFKGTLNGSDPPFTKRNVSIKIEDKTIDLKCKKAWPLIHGIHPWEVDKASSILKRYPHAVTITHKPWDDNHLHPYNYADTEVMFRENDANRPGMGECEILLSYNVGLIITVHMYMFIFKYR